MPSQTSGLEPKALESRIAICGEIAAFRFTRLLRACRVTPRNFAASVTVSPNGSMHSWRTIRPGCGGFFIFIACLLVVINQIDIPHVSVSKTKDDAPVRPNGHAPEAFQVALERMQSESREFHISGYPHT